MTKLEHFSRNLELIGSERLRNLEDNDKDDFGVMPEIPFRHRDFKIQFRDSESLEKSLGRKAKNRLVQLAGLVGYYGGFCRNYTESKRISVDSLKNSGSEVVATFEDILNNKPTSSSSSSSSHIISNPTISPLVPIFDFEDKPQVVYISMTCKSVLDVYRTKKSAENAIGYAKDCGLIQCVDDSFRFGAKNNRAKKYAWNKVCEHQLRALMKKHGIVIPSRFNGEAGTFDVDQALENKARAQELYYKVRIGKGMRTPGLTEQEIEQILFRKYRYVLEPLLERLAYYNAGRPEIEKLNFRFNIRITNGYNVKNGCRASSIAGGLKKESGTRHDNDGEYFEEYFRRVYGDEPVEYDVKGSIPRINRLVNFGVWDGWTLDPYAHMFKGFGAQSSHDRRKIAKSMYMLYEFEQSGPKIRASAVRRCPDFVKTNGKEEIRQTLEYWYAPIHAWQGDSLGSLAFLYEDAVYSKVDVELKNMGYRFIRKFDCWVFPDGHRPNKKDFWKLVEDCALKWYRGEYERERTELEFLENAGV